MLKTTVVPFAPTQFTIDANINDNNPILTDINPSQLSPPLPKKTNAIKPYLIPHDNSLNYSSKF